MNFVRIFASVVLLVVLSAFGSLAVAQNLNNSNLSSSPYNRYGYGRLGSMGNSVTRSMGDVGIAVRSNQYTTLANPASLTAIDTLTMIFTVGLDAQMGHYSESGSTVDHWDAGFSGMSFQMPLWNNFAMSLSLTPYSMVGYSYGDTQSTPILNPTIKHDTLTSVSTHTGVGGINNFMMGIGWRPLQTKMQEASVGINVGWLFGTINHSGLLATTSSTNNTYLSYEATVRGLYLQLGAQYTRRFNATHGITVGATWSPSLNMNVGTEVMKYSTDTIQISDKFRSGIKHPSSFGVGLAYNAGRKLMVTAEYELTQWSKVSGLNTDMKLQQDLFSDSHRVALGIEYLPRTATNNFFKACRYRAGFNYKTGYFRVADHELREVGATLGMSMPVNRRSAIDLGVGYSTLQPEGGSLLKENYLTINVGITFNEMMFFRNKLR